MSRKGRQFIVRHEGFVSKAYRCPAGRITIGTGFTNRSRTATAWWKRTRGRPIRMGDTIGCDENDQLLAAAIRDEYGKPVKGALGKDAPVHAVDAGTSVSFNCGPGALGWTWAKLYKAGKHRDAGNRLRVTAVTARGRKLAGLVRRRKEEAELLVLGVYTGSGSAVRHGAEDSERGYSQQLRQDQELLNKIGYPCGKPDGIWGKKTRKAVVQLQDDHGLVVDGILGPATRAKILRLANARRETAATGAAGGGSAAGAAAADTASTPADTLPGDVPAGVADWLFYGGLAILAVGLIYLAWFYRDELKSFLRRL